jgi:hypothetical protein
MSGKPSIPSWQRSYNPDTPPPTTDDQDSAASEPSPDASPKPSVDEQAKGSPQQIAQEDVSLLDQARTFLQDPFIRDAPQERKVAFLESKGVQRELIDQLLDNTIPENASPDIYEAGERAWSTVRRHHLLLSLNNPTGVSAHTDLSRHLQRKHPYIQLKLSQETFRRLLHIQNSYHSLHITLRL